MIRHTSASPTPHSSSEIARAISLFFAVRGIMRTRLAKGKKFDPSTWLRIETMKFIEDHGEPKMKDVAGYLSITAPSATSLIGGLVKSGLVVCSTDARDRRMSRIMLTKKGKTELKAAIAHGIQGLHGLFQILSKKDFDAFIGALERMKESSVE